MSYITSRIHRRKNGVTFSETIVDALAELKKLDERFTADPSSSGGPERLVWRDPKAEWPHGFGSISLDTLGGMCGVLFVFDWNAPYELDKIIKGIDFLANYGNYSKIMTTYYEGTISTELQKNGYKSVSNFYNRRSGHQVDILMKDVPK